MKRINLPFNREAIKMLAIGDSVLLTGMLYGARDAAHKKMIDILSQGEKLPIDLQGQTIYYVGPCPAKPGEVIGSAGPTTSSRMDGFAPTLLDLGLLGMIGKGQRDAAVVEAIKRNGAIYLAAIGGAGVLLADRIKQAEVIAYPELGPEALWRFVVEDFPAIVIIDYRGNNLYEEGPKAYAKKEREE